ncbi:hypothetical protein [Streptomyces sp. NPDC102409]|uniref:hypothetical protein n=1 Tax=Streptomyces sp. NPDC102409 TaxID=3366172 RepID=UPI00382CFEF8
MPLLMESGGEAANTAYGSHVLQYPKDNEYNNDHEAVQGVQKHEKFGERGARVPVSNYADALGMTTDQKDALSTKVALAYNSGKDVVEDLEKVK